ncbi:hypothetical protein HNQ40_002325 [Algisphaera agarilytica]|uniref:Uncharacterized protein n=1 Tax=Algisphaera agarilytica TaxID=1385975 RepID=A0A7X0H782_9BACT|nr:hypothetical protein [Algisphaera agarilytica]
MCENVVVRVGDVNDEIDERLRFTFTDIGWPKLFRHLFL